MRPREAVIERGENDEADESQRRENHDDLLSLLLLGGRTAAHPSRQKLRVLYHEVNGDRQRRREIYAEENPRLPVGERPRRDENQRRHDEKQEQEPAERF